MFEIDRLVEDCLEALREDAAILAVRDVVERAVSDPAAIEAALGTERHGVLDVLHTSPELTVLHVVWPPGVQLYPHEHGMWAANGIYRGREDNAYFRRTETGIVASGGQTLDAGDVGLLGEDAVHAVTNPLRSWTAAIHVYGGDYLNVPRSEWDATTLEEAPFDVEHARRVLREAEARATAG